MKRTRALAAVFATLAVLPVLLIAHAAVSAETSATAHDVKIAAVGYGTITADKTSAVAGETIQLTLTPVDGYKLTEDSLKVNGLPVLGHELRDAGQDSCRHGVLHEGSAPVRARNRRAVRSGAGVGRRSLPSDPAEAEEEREGKCERQRAEQGAITEAAPSVRSSGEIGADLH